MPDRSKIMNLRTVLVEINKKGEHKNPAQRRTLGGLIGIMILG